MRLSTKILMTSIALFCIGCESDRLDDPLSSERLVVEAYIDNNGFPSVILSTSLMPTDDPQGIASHLIRWGKVSITDGENNYIMTGAVDKSVFPPFSYRSFHERCTLGKVYTIEASYKGMKAKACARLLPPPQITGYDLVPVEANDSLRSLTVRFRQAETADTCFYIAFLRIPLTNLDYLPTFLGTLKTDDVSEEMSLRIFLPKTSLVPGRDYQPNFKIGETVQVYIARVEEVAYNFWIDYQQQISLSHNVFIGTSQSLHGNVSGAYGCFTARSGDSITIDIE